jgi:tetratricopeptide (TPR) repeat protein
MAAASSLLQRAAALTPAEDPARLRLLLEAADAQLEVGGFSIADDMLEATIEGAIALGDRRLEVTARLARLDLHYTTDAEKNDQDVIAEVETSIKVLSDVSAHDGLARAWKLLTHIHWTAGKNALAEEAALKTIEHASLAGDRVLETRSLTSLVSIARYGPRPVPEAIAECRDILDRAGEDRRVRGLTLGALAHLTAMQGGFEEARRMYRESLAVFQESGWRLLSSLTSLDSSMVEMLAGDPAAAERELRRDYEALEEIGERNYISTVAGFLAQTLFEQCKDEEADRFTRICEEAETLAREAVRLVRTSDEPDSQASALMDLGETLVLVGKLREAVPTFEEAIALLEAKGNVVSATRARTRLANLEVAAPGPARL